MEAINRSVDLLALIGADTPLKRVAGSGGGEWAGPCPLCGGTDRCRVQPREHRWLCRGCGEGKWNDAIGYVSQRDGLSFVEACDQLSGVQDAPQSARKEPPVSTYTPKVVAAPALAWQGVALECVETAEAALWAPGGTSARAYLAKRGLKEQTIRDAHLGYAARDLRKSAATCPAGITIPWFFDGDLWQLKVRRRSGSEPKYLAVTGGHPYLFTTATGLRDDGPLVLTEGEFDALLLAQEIRPYLSVTVASLGNNTTGAQGLPDGVERVLHRYDPVLLAYDNDAAGMTGVAALSRVIPRAKRLLVPNSYKDITEAWQAGWRLRDWVEANLARLAYLEQEERETFTSDTREMPLERAETCDRAGCTAKPYLERDPETGAFCAAHSASWQLLTVAALAGENVDAYRELATSGDAAAVVQAHAALLDALATVPVEA